MNETLDEASRIALSLPANERAALARTLIHSLDGADDVDVERAWDEEISQRVRRADAGEGSSREAFSVIEELRARYRDQG